MRLFPGDCTQHAHSVTDAIVQPPSGEGYLWDGCPQSTFTASNELIVLSGAAIGCMLQLCHEALSYVLTDNPFVVCAYIRCDEENDRLWTTRS